MNDFITNRKERLEEFVKKIRKKNTRSQSVNIPDGLFIKCEQCGSPIYEKQLDENMHICPYCDNHFRIGVAKRLEYTVDKGSFVELDGSIISKNPLHMPQYDEKIFLAKQIAKIEEAFIGGRAKILKEDCAIGVLDSYFMMGSMGSAVGEKISRLIEYAQEHRLPLVLFSASGGARMQEGILSLMQMAKTSGALTYFDQAGLLYISVLTNPTTGGVAASFATLGDIILAEKSSLIGFAGARVIQQTIRQELPQGFQTDVFQKEHGQVDKVVSRREMREVLGRLLQMHHKKEVAK